MGKLAPPSRPIQYFQVIINALFQKCGAWEGVSRVISTGCPNVYIYRINIQLQPQLRGGHINTYYKPKNREHRILWALWATLVFDILLLSGLWLGGVRLGLSRRLCEILIDHFLPYTYQLPILTIYLLNGRWHDVRQKDRKYFSSKLWRKYSLLWNPFALHLCNHERS